MDTQQPLPTLLQQALGLCSEGVVNYNVQNLVSPEVIIVAVGILSVPSWEWQNTISCSSSYNITRNTHPTDRDVPQTRSWMVTWYLGSSVSSSQLTWAVDKSNQVKYFAITLLWGSVGVVSTSDGHDHDRADHGGYARSWSDRGDPMIESSIKWVGPDRVIDHGHCSSIIEYSRLSSTMLEHDRFCIY